jgi:hypothetical protein
MTCGFNILPPEAEYEALLIGLRIAKVLGATTLRVHSDSQLIVGQVNSEYEVKEDRMTKYLSLVRDVMDGFNEVVVVQIPREQNIEADILAKLASSEEAIDQQIEIQYSPSHIGGTTSLSSRNSLFVALCGCTCFSYTASLNIPLRRAATILCLFSFLTGDTYLIHTYIAYITILTPPQPTPIRNIIGINIGVSIKLIKEHYSSVGSTWFIRAPQQSPLPVHRERRSSI